MGDVACYANKLDYSATEALFRQAGVPECSRFLGWSGGNALHALCASNYSRGFTTPTLGAKV